MPSPETSVSELEGAHPLVVDATGQLTRRQKIRLMKDIAEVTVKLRRADLYELFSPERVGPTAELKGLGSFKALDLTTSWDLLRSDHRREMWRRPREDEPD